MVAPKIMIFTENLCFLLVFKARTLLEARKSAEKIRRRAGGVSSASHLPREHWLTVHRGPEVGASMVRMPRRNTDFLCVFWLFGEY